MPPDNTLVIAGASTVGRGTPMGTLAEIVARCLTPRGYSCRIEPTTWGHENGRWVSDRRADLGAWNFIILANAFNGTANFESEGKRDNLRVIAHVNHSAWIGMAVKLDSGITDLAQVVAEQRAVRVRLGGSAIFGIIRDYYGWTAELLESWGGSLRSIYEEHTDPDTAPVAEPKPVPWVTSGDFDVIIDSIYSGYTPEIPHWAQATNAFDLRFLPMPDDLVARICAAKMGTPSAIPHRLMRGIWADVPSTLRLPQAVYCRDDTPDALVTDVAGALNENRNLFRECHLAYSYDPANVAIERGVPLHPAAVAYYESVGFPTS